MLVELIITLSIIVAALGISYPSVVAIMGSVDEQVSLTKIVQKHNKNMLSAVKADRPIEVDGVMYYPNLHIQPTTLVTNKHVIKFGKYNTLRIERKK